MYWIFPRVDKSLVCGIVSIILFILLGPTIASIFASMMAPAKQALAKTHHSLYETYEELKQELGNETLVDLAQLYQTSNATTDLIFTFLTHRDLVLLLMGLSLALFIVSTVKPGR